MLFSRSFLCLSIHIKQYFLFFADIQSVSPSSGSLHGGTVLTIQGLGFSDNAENVKVFVAGVLFKNFKVTNLRGATSTFGKRKSVVLRF